MPVLGPPAVSQGRDQSGYENPDASEIPKTRNRMKTFLTFAVSGCLLSINASHARTYTNTIPNGGSISFYQVNDGLGGLTNNISVAFGVATQTLILDYPNNTLRFLASMSAPSVSTMLHGSNYDLTVTLAPTGNVVMLDSGSQPINSPFIHWNNIPFDGAYEWITGGQTNRGSFQFSVDPSAEYTMSLLTNDYPNSVSMSGFFDFGPTIRVDSKQMTPKEEGKEGQTVFVASQGNDTQICEDENAKSTGPSTTTPAAARALRPAP